MRYEICVNSSCFSKPPPQKGTNTQKKNRVKNTGYKINLDFDVIYTKHMLIIYLKIIYLLFFSTKQNFVHDPLTTKQCRVLDLRIWTTVTSKNDWLLHHAPFSREKFLGLCTIYKQARMRSVCIWYSCHACFESVQ